MDRRTFLTAALGLPKRQPKTKTSQCEVWIGTARWKVETQTQGKLPVEGTVLVKPLSGDCTYVSAEVVCGKKERYWQRLEKL